MDCGRVVEVAHLSHDQSVRASVLVLRSPNSVNLRPFPGLTGLVRVAPARAANDLAFARLASNPEIGLHATNKYFYR